MAKVVGGYSKNDVCSAPRSASVSSALLVNGAFIHINSSGEIILADHRNAQSKPSAHGVLTMGADHHDALGNVTRKEDRLSFVTRGKIGGLSLTPGLTYYLSSGGGILNAKPGSAGDLGQEVGFALTASTLVLRIGPATIQ